MIMVRRDVHIILLIARIIQMAIIMLENLVKIQQLVGIQIKL